MNLYSQFEQRKYVIVVFRFLPLLVMSIQALNRVVVNNESLMLESCTIELYAVAFAAYFTVCRRTIAFTSLLLLSLYARGILVAGVLNISTL